MAEVQVMMPPAPITLNIHIQQDIVEPSVPTPVVAEPQQIQVNVAGPIPVSALSIEATSSTTETVLEANEVDGATSVVTDADPDSTALTAATEPEPESDNETPEDGDSTSEPTPTERVPVEPWVIDGPAFAFDEEEEVDLGTVWVGEYKCYEPEAPEADLPFSFTEDDDLGDVLQGNRTNFAYQRFGHEFHRNYLRGHTMMKLRTSQPKIKTTTPKFDSLLMLPTELLYEILEIIHPLDLLHMSRATKQLRKILLDKRTDSVWRNSYQEHWDLPTCPPEVSPPKWTSMIFGHAICDFCGNAGALLDIAFDEHYCDDCMRKHYVERGDLAEVMDNLPRHLPIIYTLVIPSFRSSGRKYHTYYETDTNALYRRRDINEMTETITGWLMLIDEGLFPDAGDKFAEFQQKKANECREIGEYAQRVNNWAMTLYYTMCNELSTYQRTMAEKCMKRFTKLGYDERDTTAAISDVYYFFRHQELSAITMKEFREYKEVMITKIIDQKKARLKRERREIVDKLFHDYKKTLKPSQWTQLPPMGEIIKNEMFENYINQDSEELGELPLADAHARYPEVVKQWIGEQRRTLYELLPSSSETQDEEVPEDDTEEKAAERAAAKEKALQEVTDKRMKLATSIFTCVMCKGGRQAGMALIGWDAACTHMCGSSAHFFHHNWEFCSLGYATAASIIRQLGLDPETATPADLDARDARFFCGNCPVRACRGIQGRRALTWNECVTHAVENEEDHTHAIGAWLLLSKDAIYFAKAHENPHPLPRKHIWGCNHCPEHIDTAVPRRLAIEHVNTTHSIENPVIGIDVIDFKNRYERGGNYRRRRPFHYGIEPSCNLKCRKCLPHQVDRMWTMQSLVPHLFDKHGVSSPIPGEDFVKIEIMSTATPEQEAQA